MSASPFSYELVQLPALDLAGIFVSTSMESSQKDCPSLWFENFMPLAAPLFDKINPVATYGLSFVHADDVQAFDYWAALPWRDKEIPAGMKKSAIPAGSYLKCTVKTLQELGEAYTKMFEHIMADPHLEFSMGAPSIEEYPAAYPNPEILYLYMPVHKV